MKSNRFNRITITMAAIVMTLLFCVSGTFVRAQNIDKPSDLLQKQRLDKKTSAPQDVEEFRAEMKQYLTDLGNALSNFEAIPAVSEQFNKNGMDPVGAIDRAKANLEKISTEDLARMQEAYAKHPNWKEGSRVIYEISQKIVNKSYPKSATVKKQGGITSEVITPDTCPDISATPSYTDIAILKAFQIAADAVMEALPTDVLTILGRLPAIAAKAALDGSVLAVETLRGLYEFCISPSTQDVVDIVTAAKDEILANDDSNTTNIINNDNSNKDTIVNNDNANKTTIVNNDNANTLALTNLINATRIEILNTVNDSKEETNNLLLRTQIEADLSSTDGSTFVALYETPSNICLPSLNQKGLPQIGALSNPVQCGLLDLVRSIVRDTIANINTSSTASAFFAKGDAQRAAGDYKGAYTSYRQAYKAASK